jgi:hypothetical protein
LLIFNRWSQLSFEHKQDFLNYLRILCERKLIAGNKIRLFEAICIPALANADGEINDTMDTYNQVAQYGVRLYQINDLLAMYYQELHWPVSVKKAAQYLGLSDRYVRELAKRGIPHLDATLKKGRWCINLVSASDWLIRHHKVHIV